MTQLSTKADIIGFLHEQGYETTEQDPLLIIQDEDGLNIFAVIDDTQIEFMVDLCGVNDLDTSKLEEIYERILDQNTETLPCCFGIDSDDPNNKQIFLSLRALTNHIDANRVK